MQQTAGVAEPNTAVDSPSDLNTCDVWDNLAFDPVLTDADTSYRRQATTETPAHSQGTRTIGPIPIEDQIIALPSNGNTSNIFRALEIRHRISVAEEQLNHIRNLIAEKSFQFSHVIRVSPRKGVTTRSRAVVRKLNNQIAEHCRFYARCRTSLLILSAEQSILSQFRVLNPEDVIGSTAVLKPNQPGSTNVKLSWIWQTSPRNILLYNGPLPGVGRDENDMAEDTTTMAEKTSSLLECLSIFF